MISNPCTRCGRERIISKTWKEHIETHFGDSIVVHTETVCPNKECQQVVDKEIYAQKQKRDKIKKEREQRSLEFKRKGRKPSISL